MSHNTQFQKEIENAKRINELRSLINFLVENGMFNNTVLYRPEFKTALAIADEQRELEQPPLPLWKRPKESR